MKTVGILGCGWLRLALAKKLQPSFHLNVSTTTPSKCATFQSLSYNTFIIDENRTDSLEAFLKCDYLVIALPPSKFKDYISFLKMICSSKNFVSISHTIFISSSSVYESNDGEYDESSIINTPTSKIVYEAEQAIDKSITTIFRCAGLMGENRIAGKYFAGKMVEDKNAPVNYVHQTDVVLAIIFALEKNLQGVYNLCAPNHPTKEQVYRQNALKYGFEVPVFKNEMNRDRIIKGEKICAYGFEYTYSNPLAF